MTESAREMRIPRQLLGSLASVEDAISALRPPADMRALIAELDEGARVVSLPVESEESGRPAIQIYMLGELVGALVLMSGDVELVGSAVAGVPWAEAGFVLWVAGWRAPRRKLVAGLYRCSHFVETWGGSDRGRFNPLQPFVESAAKDLFIAWEPCGAQLSGRLADVASRMDGANDDCVVDAILRCSLHYSEELAQVGGKELTRLVVQRELESLHPDEYEFVRTARLAVLLDLALRGIEFE